MARVLPTSGRIQYDLRDGFVRVDSRPQRQFLAGSFMCFWLIGWAIGEVIAIGILVSGFVTSGSNGSGSGGGLFAGGISLFMVVWLAGWTLGGVMVFRQVFWMFAGREQIEITSLSLTHRVRSPIMSKVKEYDLAEISRMRVASFNPHQAQMNAMRGGMDSISFRYGDKTCTMGRSLSNDEAEDVLDRVRAIFPEIVVDNNV